MNCFKCQTFERCLSGVLENLEIKCIYFGCLRAQVNETVDRLNSIGTVCPLSTDEVKALVYFSTIENMKE